MKAEVLEQVGRQVCRQAGSNSDRKLHKSFNADTDADRLACKEVTDR